MMIDGHVIAIAAIAVAIVILAENRANPDRFFGLRVDKTRLPNHRAVASRILAAARSLAEAKQRRAQGFDPGEFDDEITVGESQPDVIETRHALVKEAAQSSSLVINDPKEEFFAATALHVPLIAPSTAPEMSYETGIAAGVLASVEDRVDDNANPAVDDDVVVPVPAANSRPVMWPRLLGLSSRDLSLTERHGIVLTLAALGEEREDLIAPVLSEVLGQEEDPAIRDAALEAARDARLVGALVAIEDCLISSRDRERVLAVEALAAMGEVGSASLIGALSDPCVAVVMAAAAALRKADAISENDLREEIAQGADEARAEQVAEMLATIS